MTVIVTLALMYIIVMIFSITIGAFGDIRWLVMLGIGMLTLIFVGVMMILVLAALAWLADRYDEYKKQ